MGVNKGYNYIIFPLEKQAMAIQLATLLYLDFQASTTIQLIDTPTTGHSYMLAGTLLRSYIEYLTV